MIKLVLLLTITIAFGMLKVIGQVETSFYDTSSVIEVDTLDRKAYKLLEEKEYKNSLNCFQNILQIDPKNIAAHMGKAKCQFELGNYLKSYNTYKTILEFNDSNIYALEGIGNSLLFLKEFDEALKFFNRSITLYPENISIYYSIALAKFCLKKFQKAAEFSNKSILLYKQSGLESPYSFLLTYLCYIQSNNKIRVEQLVNYMKGSSFEDGWPKNIVEFVIGDIDKVELLSFVKSKFQEAEAHTYIAFKLIYEGELELGIKHLNWVKEVEGFKSNETLLSDTIILEPKA